MTDNSLPEVRAWPWGRGYQGHFRKPGGSWQFVRAADQKTAEIFPTSEKAKDAATAIVFKFMCPEIVAHREPDEKTVATVLDVAGWKADKARREVESRVIRRGDGKRAVIVERRKGA